ncbi:Uncharacterised protein [Legionella lansingensis]|uniref:Uncharacterized protein n=1 Tax=Legionella lansingensis TaxID=45067 RepID=A0A0W0VV67_9GAMM|nr:hypothetical protein [Legionella lansingensis]KTD23857.1 hypothetical protein Llan_0638 [Legionella lansingensis]SNV46640.1 Uncharacterised protein [Legionella lansingensis]
MTNIASLRWLTRGHHKPPLIQYMLLDKHLEYLISPKEIVVTDLKKNLNDIFLNIQKFSRSYPLEIRYKSITHSYGGHRKDSEQFHFLLNKILEKKNLLQPNCRMASLLKKEDLTLFKNALYLLDIDSKTRGRAFVAHLWAIALKATKSRIIPVIKKIWKIRHGITRLNKASTAKFSEFYSHL